MRRKLAHVAGLMTGLAITWTAGAQTIPPAPSVRPVGTPPANPALRRTLPAASATVASPSAVPLAPSGLPQSDLFLERPARPVATPVPQRSLMANASVPVHRPDAFVFDSREKTVNVKAGETKAEFKWAVTNSTSEEVTITSVHTSCGCTAAKLPTYPNPWVMKPGEGGEVGATMDLTGKFGTVTKTVTIVSSVGQFPLTAKAVLPQEAFTQMQRQDNRARNLQVAAADRQAVFRNDCATCHVQPAVGKHGRELYATACGVCHEAEHRASMVTQLRGRPGSFPRDYWLNWIRNGKDGSLMPAFELKKGGPLSDDQIESLATYLETQFPQEAAPVRLNASHEGPAAATAVANPTAATGPGVTQ